MKRATPRLWRSAMAREKSLAADPPTPFTRAKKASLMARISWTLMSSESVTMRMSSINGATSGIVATITPFLRAMFPMMSSATRTWMNTVAGGLCRSTGTCGLLLPALSAGRPFVLGLGLWPSHRVRQTYVTNVNVSNTTIINRTQVTNVYNNVYVNKTVNVTNVRYQNQTAPNAVTAVSHQTFVSAQPVHNNLIRVGQKEFA